MTITEKEIYNQLETWTKIDDIITKESKNLVDSIDDDTIVIFTGAGTSGYIGDSIINILNKDLKSPKFFSYYSTHIVGDMQYLINENQKILLVSFARSGNSPESLHTIKEVNQACKNVKHLVITCNKEGDLAKINNAEIILLPEETNDEGFAMTNSFSTMALVALKLFGAEFNICNILNYLKENLNKFDYEKILNADFKNIIFLGNTGLVGITNEYLLKTTELTAGKYGYYNEHILNFRHGPKSVITKPSLIFIIKSATEKANQYEEDLVAELISDENKPSIVVLGNTNKDVFYKYECNLKNDCEIMFCYLPILQLLAVKLSQFNNINPDNPSPSGSVNRVVQGVILH